LIGLGKIGEPIAMNFLAQGYRVVGFRRGSMIGFEQAGGTSARSAAEVGCRF